MDLLTTIDTGLTNATRTFFLVLGLWGVFRSLRGQGIDGSYLGALAIGAGLFVLGLIFDIVLWFGGTVPERAGLHYLYAIFAALLVPFIYASVLRGEVSNQAQWIFAFVCLFLWGVVDRIIVLGI